MSHHSRLPFRWYMSNFHQTTANDTSPRINNAWLHDAQCCIVSLKSSLSSMSLFCAYGALCTMHIPFRADKSSFMQHKRALQPTSLHAFRFKVQVGLLWTLPTHAPSIMRMQLRNHNRNGIYFMVHILPSPVMAKCLCAACSNAPRSQVPSFSFSLLILF